jgi:uncharacterized protein with PIN domain
VTRPAGASVGPAPPPVELRVHGSLNDFLAPALRESVLTRQVAGRPAVKDVLEAAGVPHPEIALVRINGASAELGHRLSPGDRVAAFPSGWPDPPTPTAGEALRRSGVEVRFVLDGHLGRLAAYLRMCGFPATYRRDATDDELAALAASEDRVLLSRDIGLLKRAAVRWGRFVRGERPEDQLVEVLGAFGLAGRVRPFARCLRCDSVLEPVARHLVRDEVPPRVFREQDAFRRCPGCGGIYWRGSHHARMTRLLERALVAAAPGGVESDRRGLEPATPRPVAQGADADRPGFGRLDQEAGPG